MSNTEPSQKPLTADEILAHVEQWWGDRKRQYNESYGFHGRDLRHQEDLLKTVVDMEQDVTQLLRYVRDLAVLARGESTDVAVSPSPPEKTKQSSLTHDEKTKITEVDQL